MKTFGLICAGTLGFLVLIVIILGLTWIGQGNEFFLYKFFAPKMEDTRREVFEHSKAYRQGMVQELENMQFEYAKADPKHKDALADIILHRAADVDPSALTPELNSFIAQLRRDRITPEHKEFK